MIRPLARLAGGASAAVVAAWLLPASVHVVSWPAAGPVRVAMLPSLKGLLVGAAVVLALLGAAAIQGRRHPAWLQRISHVAAPLALLWIWTVPYLPWLPDRAPLLLVFAGPLRWVIAAVAVGRAVWVALAPRLIFAGRMERLRPAIALVSFALFALLGLRSASTVGFSGDEPHYLVIAHSLLVDHDLDIQNNHAQRDYRAFFPGDLRPDYLRRGTHGEVYSIHAPGLPALLLPGYAIAGARGAVVTMAAIAAAAAIAIFDAALLLTASLPAAVAAWAGVCLAVPFVPHAWMIYPEMPGALLIAWAVVWLLAPLPSTRISWVLRGAGLAVLPWLHTKFVVLLALFTIYVLTRLRSKRLDAAAFVAPIAISGLLWLFSFYRMYGVLDPEAPYGSYTDTHVLLQNIPRGLLGLFFDQKFGLMPYAPVYMVAALGAWLLMRDRTHRIFAIELAGAALLFLASTTRLYMWWGGASPPARFLVPILPMLAPAIAVAFARIRAAAARPALYTALVATVAIAAFGLAEPLRLFSTPHGVSSLWASLQNGAPLVQLLPTFTEENWRAPLVLLVPWTAALVVSALFAFAIARRTPAAVFGALATAACAFVVVAAVLLGGRMVAAADRQSIAQAGAVALADAYDPSHVRGFAYGRMKRLSDTELLSLCAVVSDRSAAPNLHRPLEGPFTLPAGRYRAAVWLDGSRPRDGSAVVHVGRSVTVASAPFSTTSASLEFALPIAAPVSVGVATNALADAVRRIEIAPTSLEPKSSRPSVDVRGAGPVDGNPLAFAVYVDDHTRPEGATFWTLGMKPSSVIVATAGSGVLRLTLRAGSASGSTATVDAGNHHESVRLNADEIRSLDVPLRADQHIVPLTVVSSTAFRPVDVDSKSTDTRLLGCQVRLELR